MAFDLKGVLGWLSANGVSPECVLCGANEWHGLGGDGHGRLLPLVLTADSADGPVENHGHRVIAVACARCGFVVLLSLDAMDAAVTAPDAPPEDL